jgi:mono/diheme cytochrome c family protein
MHRRGPARRLGLFLRLRAGAGEAAITVELKLVLWELSLKKIILKFAMLCCLAASLAKPAPAQDPGADTYKARCAMCHGNDGLATTPAGQVFKAASFKDPVIMKTPDADLIAIVKAGKNKNMPPFGDKLSDDQIKAVVAYIHTLQK